MTTAAESTGYALGLRFKVSDSFERIMVLVRILVAWLIGSLPMFWILLALPVISALLVSSNGAQGFRERYGENYRKLLRVWVELNAWLYFVTESFPNWNEEGAVAVTVRRPAEPTVGSALLRYITVIPHAIVIAILGFVAWIFAIIAGIGVLLNRRVPQVSTDVGRSYSAYVGRTTAYYVSMVDEYPPFTLQAEV